MVPPSGLDAAANAAIEIAEGFNLGIVRAQPGNGPMMHNHDTNETFMPLTGTWRVSWEVDGGAEYFDLSPYDVVSVPPGVQRRFENITWGEPGQKIWGQTTKARGTRLDQAESISSSITRHGS